MYVLGIYKVPKKIEDKKEGVVFIEKKGKETESFKSDNECTKGRKLQYTT